MPRVFVSVGSNIEPAVNICSAMQALRGFYPELTFSTVYESEAVGFDGDNFYNFVLAFDTDDDVVTVAKNLRYVEDTHARDRSGPQFSSRTIDLDLLLYDDLIFNENGLNIPRDEICHNAFVLLPLSELAPEVQHPTTGQTIAQMWQAYDQSRQRLWPIALDCL